MTTPPDFTVSRLADHPDLTEIAPGVTVRPLLMTQPRDGSDPLPLVALAWFEPGAALPDDHHGDSVEINAIISGALDSGALDHQGELLHAGTELRCEVGSTHSPCSPEGGPGACVLVWFPDRMPR